MKIFTNVVLTILVFLSISSGITKIMLMPQDVEFFGKYGFSNPLLIAYGAVQLVGGILLIIPETRAFGALVVAITFLISLAVLVMAGNLPVAFITLVCIGLLGYVAREALKSRKL